MTRGSLMRPAGLAGCVALLTVAGAAAAAAQCARTGLASPPAVKRAIVGVVMDTSHAPLEDVELAIRAPRRRGRSNTQGLFRLDSLEPGKYEVIVRRIGYGAVMQTIAVTDSGGVARFCLVPEPQGLQPMITSVFRGGLSGVIGDTTFAVVPDAEVRIMGMGAWALTDSAGAFYIPVKKGTYAVRVSRKPYGQQLLSVTVPEDSGRKIAVWLGSRPRNANSMAVAIEGLRQRVLLTPAHRYHIVSSEDLATTDMNITQAVRVAGRTNVQDDCEAGIAGTMFSLPLYMLNKEEIAMMEVVSAPLTRGGRTTRPGSARGAFGVVRPDSCPAVIVWMKP